MSTPPRRVAPLQTNIPMLTQAKKCFHFHTHDDDMGQALEGGLFDLGDLVLVDAQLLQAPGHVGGHVLQHVLRQVEALQLGQGAEGLGVDDGDFVVDQDQRL